MSTLRVAELYGELANQLGAASGALFFNGICILLFALAVFYLQKTKTQASRIFLALSVILLLFAFAQVFLDVTLAVLFLRITQNLVGNGSQTETLAMEQNWTRIYIAREALLSINKHVSPSFLSAYANYEYLGSAVTDCLLLYRCAAIWSSSPYARVVIAIPSMLILATLVTGLYTTFGVDVPTSPIPYSLALVTNFLLLGLTAGRIWRKGRQATVVLGIEAGRKYNRTLEIICESSLLYFLNVLFYLIASEIAPTALVTGIVWGAIAQVVNIVPMMIMVRVGIAKNTGEKEDNSRIFYGGNSGRFGMTPISDVTTPLNGKYSEM
ncbi:hypothetical protein MVEN_00179900 [Mycena venus]|uniref:Uncharacterized protein n=1 Tax=Mycena venus TaxID=2733690 RepID=A0A8H6Z1B3_9AGAR|nr:hypothetical protein MVEN_00179900 [Mycena venus]